MVRFRPVALILLGLSLLVLLGSRFYPSISRIHVLGASHFSEAEILQLADIRVGEPLLWVTTWHLSRLEQNPWIRDVRATRQLPGTLYIEVEERRPLLVKGTTGLAEDGTVLPNVSAREQRGAVPLRGWGRDRSQEALELYRLLADRRPQVVSYAPSGFTVSFAGSSLYTPDVASLRAHWSAFVSQRTGNVAVYPWGVSVQQ